MFKVQSADSKRESMGWSEFGWRVIAEDKTIYDIWHVKAEGYTLPECVVFKWKPTDPRDMTAVGKPYDRLELALDAIWEESR